jgi:DNA-binding NarL/FixJ family response regulator
MQVVGCVDALHNPILSFAYFKNLTVKRTILIYALCMAALLFVLKAVEYQFLVRDMRVEVYVGIIALICTAVGVYAGWRLTRSGHKTSFKEALAAPEIPEILTDETTLSARELEVLTLIAAGFSNQEIADRLFLSLNTIKKHVTSLFTKLEVKRRTQAIEKAKRTGLIS